jgi:hypothetical protein
MSEPLTHLQRLQAERHELRQVLAKANRVLGRPSAALHVEDSCDVSDAVRVSLARWESITREITQLLARGSNRVCCKSINRCDDCPRCLDEPR